MGFNQLEGARAERARQASEFIQHLTGVIAVASNVESAGHTDASETRELSLVQSLANPATAPRTIDTRINIAV